MPTSTKTTGLSLRQLAERDERVFPTYPQVARYFPAAAIEDARTRITRAIDRGDGPAVAIGGPGTGKSLLLQVIAAQFYERFDVVLPACARLCTRRALLQAILFELGLPYKLRNEGDLRLSLLDHLLSREECPTGLLLLVDEAHTLTTALLDELRVLTNVVRGGMPRVRLVLAGSSALEECFADPELESFSQRLSSRCYLGPFHREETTQFVRAQLSASGAAAEEVIAADAWPAIFEATDGVPRLVNQLCDRALSAANAAGALRVDGQIIQAAWADIQQLPTPWDTPAIAPRQDESPQIIEFGNLSDAAPDRAAEMSLADELLNDRGLDDSLLAEVEPTDLDDDEVVITATTGPAAKSWPSIAPAVTTSDPFAEKFDEEEVVLDTFSAWDDMFRREAPRVQNRRDPEFATLVQAAITTADEEDADYWFSTTAAARAVADAIERAEADSDQTPVDEAQRQSAGARPALRIAFGSDAEPAPPKAPLVEARRPGCATPAAPVAPSESVDWSHFECTNEAAVEQPAAALSEEPVLIIEDDAAAASPPVRREQYRNLFSRLRSG